MTLMTRAARSADAKNRAVRSFVQGLAVDVGVAASLVLITMLNPAAEWGDVQWAVLGFTLAKTIVVSAASYVMRMFLDPSKVPTPTPPTDTQEA